MFFRFCVLCFFLILLSFGRDNDLHADIRIVGSDFLSEVMQEVFHKEETDAESTHAYDDRETICIEMESSALAWMDLERDQADLAILAIPRGYKDKPDWVYQVIGYKVAFIIIKASNEIEEIHFNELYDIYRGHEDKTKRIQDESESVLIEIEKRQKRGLKKESNRSAIVPVSAEKQIGDSVEAIEVCTEGGSRGGNRLQKRSWAMTWGMLGAKGNLENDVVEPYATDLKGGIAIEIFREKVLDGGEWGGMLKKFSTDEEVKRKVIEDSHRIGIVNWMDSSSETEVKALRVGADCAAFSPKSEHIFRGDYPLSLPFYVVYRRDKQAILQPILNVLWSDGMAEKLESRCIMPLPRKIREAIVNLHGSP